MSNTADQDSLGTSSEAALADRDQAEQAGGASAEQAGGAGAEQARGASFVRLRRAPRYLPFMISGGALGLVVAAVLTALSRRLADPLAATTLGVGRNYSAMQVLLYLGLALVAIGGMLGAAVALLLERRRR